MSEPADPPRRHDLRLTADGAACSCGWAEPRPFRGAEISAARAVEHLPAAVRHPHSPLTRTLHGDGKTGPTRRLRIWEHQRRRCAYCEHAIELLQATIDHVLPRARGGTSEWGNLVIACKQCNAAKGVLTVVEWARSELCPRRVRELVAAGHDLFGTPNLDKRPGPFAFPASDGIRAHRTARAYPALAVALRDAGLEATA